MVQTSGPVGVHPGETQGTARALGCPVGTGGASVCVFFCLACVCVLVLVQVWVGVCVWA